ncbi:hypothetical protein K488DRAFT_26616, partial [Vararia minispora EC-137]
ESTAYRLPCYFFIRDSSWFASCLEPDPDGLIRTIILDDVTSTELDAFLSVLYPENFTVGDLTEQIEWIAVLKLATQWSFQSIRHLAITKLDPLVSPMDRLLLARAYNVQIWVDVALHALCIREEPLSLPEIRRMAYIDIALIS